MLIREISLEKISNNFLKVKENARGRCAFPVVKNNAYELGLMQ